VRIASAGTNSGSEVVPVVAGTTLGFGFLGVLKGLASDSSFRFRGLAEDTERVDERVAGMRKRTRVARVFRNIRGLQTF
jgi:hypothetical protein